MKRIIHLSDLHVGHSNLLENFNKIVNKITSEKDDKAEKFIIVITGDLVDRYKKKYYDDVKEGGLKKLEDNGFKDILIVPGNHDYLTIDSKKKKGTSSELVDEFKKTFLNTDEPYPMKRIIKDEESKKRIAFILLDSMADNLDKGDKDWAKGKLGDEQLKQLKKLLLKDPEVKNANYRIICLHHNPFFTVEGIAPHVYLLDRENFEDAIKDVIKKGVGIDAILCGHSHIDFPEAGLWPGDWGVDRCYDAGTATGKKEPVVSDIPGISDLIGPVTRCIHIYNSANRDHRMDLLRK